MRDYEKEFRARVEWIRSRVQSAHAKGIVFGNSGGKDSALVGILCKAACEDTVGVIMPCASRQNYGTDAADGRALAEAFGIETRTVDLTATRASLVSAAGEAAELNSQALTNIAPRLRMTALYSIAAAEGRLVAGTGNRSEIYMGYFTKWGDGASDFDPIADLSATEVFAFLEYLGAPRQIIEKAPSAGLYEGQTDEKEMGVSYAEIDALMAGEEISPESRAIIDRYHASSEHKRRPVAVYGGD